MKKKQLAAFGAIMAIIFTACSNPFWPEKKGDGGKNPAKTDPDVTWPAGLTATVGQTLADIPLPGNGNGDGTFTWTNPTDLVGAVGQRTHNMTFTPNDTDAYNTLTHDVVITVVSGNSGAGINIDVDDIDKGDPVLEIEGGITISRTGANSVPVTFTVTVSNSSAYSGIAWVITAVGDNAGTNITGTGASFTLDADDVRYNAIGTHALNLTVEKGGQSYHRVIPFEIVQ